jgi:hypothetical protein
MVRPAIVALSSIVLLLACGGSQAPAQNATDVSSESVSAEDVEGEPSEVRSEESAEAAEVVTASPDDIRAVLQLVADDEEINRSLQLDKPGRFPLKISGSDLPGDLKLTNGNRAVVIVDEPKSEKDPVLVLTKIEVDAKRANIGFRYDVENVRGTARYKKTSSGWELANVRVVQH